MVYRKELVLALAVFGVCLAQDLTFPTDSETGEQPDDRLGGMPPFSMGSRPGVNPSRPFQGPGRPFPGSNQFTPGQGRPFPGSNQRFPNQNRPFPDTNQRRPDQNRPFPGSNQPVPSQNSQFQGSNQPAPSQNSQFQGSNQPAPSQNSQFQGSNQPAPTQNSQFQGSNQPQPSSTNLKAPPVSEQKVINIVPCPCQYTPQYSPVCGSDSQTYASEAILNCFRSCGFDLSLSHTSACRQTAAGQLGLSATGSGK